MRRLIAVIAALAVFVGTTAESCKDNAPVGGNSRPETRVVNWSVSATGPGIDWTVSVPGPNKTKRFWGGSEKTNDHHDRFEITRGKDLSVTVTAGRSTTQTYHCQIRVLGGLVVDDETAVGYVSCFKTADELFAAR